MLVFAVFTFEPETKSGGLLVRKRAGSVLLGSIQTIDPSKFFPEVLLVLLLQYDWVRFGSLTAARLGGGFFLHGSALLLIEGLHALADKGAGDSAAARPVLNGDPVNGGDQVAVRFEVELPRGAWFEVELHWCSVR